MRRLAINADFSCKGQPLLMLQHLKIGVKHSPNRTLRLHFAWDPEDGVVVIGQSSFARQGRGWRLIRVTLDPVSDV